MVKPECLPEFRKVENLVRQIASLTSRRDSLRREGKISDSRRVDEELNNLWKKLESAIGEVVSCECKFEG